MTGLGLGCGQPGGENHPDLPGGTAGEAKVQGKVTYKGQPVPFGYVLFLNHRSIDPKTKTMRPIAFAPIAGNGSYVANSLPAGPVQLAVVADPDADLLALTRPKSLGGPPPGLPGPAGGKGPGPGGVTPGAPPGGAGHKGPPGGLTPRAGPPLPPLTAAQQKLLKEVHEKYGSLEKSKLSYVVKKGEQTHDITLD
jgi:hypothetical protein